MLSSAVKKLETCFIDLVSEITESSTGFDACEQAWNDDEVFQLESAGARVDCPLDTMLAIPLKPLPTDPGRPMLSRYLFELVVFCAAMHLLMSYEQSCPL